MRRFSIFIVVIFLFQCHSDKGTGVDYDIFSNKIIFSKDKAFHRFNRINKKEIEINSFLSTKNAIFEVQNDTLVYFTVFNLAVVNKYKIVIHDTIAKIEKVSSKIDTKLVHNIDTFKYCAYFIKSNEISLD